MNRSLSKTLFLPGFLLWLFAGMTSHAQEITIGNPLPVQPSLSGNFGELRPNHFHAGVDLKTAGREGLEIKSVLDGHVSRIKVSPWGYGKVLYIDHPNGLTTVYAHLRSFSPKIEAYLKRYQYAQQTWEIDLYPGAEELPVTKDEIVALSGNTGGSAGPHLHFEVRETDTEIPRNPLLYGFPITDHKAPVMEVIAVTPIGNGSRVNGSDHPFRTRKSGGTIRGAQPVQVQGAFGVEMMGYDSQDDSYNQNGVFEVQLLVDDSLVSRFVADSIPFHQSRQLNALIDYTYYYKNRQRYLRLYRVPGNKLENLSYKNDGILLLPSGTHQIEVIARDLAGNATAAKFEVSVSEAETENEEDEENLIEWDVPYLHESESAMLYLPAQTLYESIPVDVEEGTIQGRPSVRILDPSIPVEQVFEIRLKIPEGVDRNGLMIAQVNASGRVSRMLSSTEDGEWMRAESKSLGTFSLSYDQNAPRILPGNFRSGVSYSSGELRFEVKDAQSGIDRYKATIDGEWLLMEYEPKQDLMFIHVKDIPQRSEEQHLKLEITDLAGNVATFEGTLKHP